MGAMSTRQSANGLMAFLLWNAVVNAIHKRTQDFVLQHLRATWFATRARYEALILNYGIGMPQTRLTNAGIFGTILVAVLTIFIVAALISPVANLTTGVTIAHTGFTPNKNITDTPGLTPIMQLYPLVFAFTGIIIVAKFFSEESRGL